LPTTINENIKATTQSPIPILIDGRSDPDCRATTARNAIAPTLKNDGDGRQHEQWEKRHNFRGDWVCIAPMHDEFQQVRKETSQEVHMNRVCRRLPGAKIFKSGVRVRGRVQKLNHPIFSWG
jgi:hypothetical protein